MFPKVFYIVLRLVCVKQVISYYSLLTSVREWSSLSSYWT